MEACIKTLEEYSKLESIGEQNKKDVLEILSKFKINMQKREDLITIFKAWDKDLWGEIKLDKEEAAQVMDGCSEVMPFFMNNGKAYKDFFSNAMLEVRERKYARTAVVFNQVEGGESKAEAVGYES